MQTKMKYFEEFKCAKEISLLVGEFLLEQDIKVINSLKDKDIKLELDKISEEKIINNLKPFGFAILSEEMGLIGKKEYNKPIWIIDPIDGTLNYSRNNPSSCISIALYVGDKPIFGIIYDFNRDEMFSGYVGIGSWLNETRLIKNDTLTISQSILATGFPTYFEHDAESLTKFVHHIQKYKKIRMIGSAAISLAYVASGRFDAYIENNIKIWDVAAGIAINKALDNFIKINLQGNYLVNVEVGNISSC